MSLIVKIDRIFANFELHIDIATDSKRIGILGASGCGKSMTLKSIAGIEQPDCGKIMIGERVLYDSDHKVNLPPQKRNIGYLFQNYALFPTMTISENIAAGLNGEKHVKKARVEQMLQKFDIAQLADMLPGQLSGGQQQRVALARIMAYQPDVILLDEPFSALDIFLKDRMQLELEKLLEDYEGIVIMVSHSRDEIYRFSKEVVIMNQGRIITSGETKELFTNPKYIDAARLTGCKNFSGIAIHSAQYIELTDWGAMMEIEEEINPECTYIGYRAHYFVPHWEKPEKNYVQVELYSRVDMLFEKKMYFHPVSNPECSICWIVQQKDWILLEQRGVPAYLELTEEGMMFLLS